MAWIRLDVQAQPDQLTATLTTARRQAPGSVHQAGQAPPGYPLAGLRAYPAPASGVVRGA